MARGSGDAHWSDTVACSACGKLVHSTARFCGWCGASIALPRQVLGRDSLVRKLASSNDTSRYMALLEVPPTYWGAMLDSLWALFLHWKDGRATLRIYRQSELIDDLQRLTPGSLQASPQEPDAVTAPARWDLELGLLDGFVDLVEAPLVGLEGLFLVQSGGVIWWPSRSNQHPDYDHERVRSGENSATQQPALPRWELPAADDGARIVAACLLPDHRVCLLTSLPDGQLAIRAGFGAVQLAKDTFKVIAILPKPFQSTTVYELLPTTTDDGFASVTILSSEGAWEVALGADRATQLPALGMLASADEGTPAPHSRLSRNRAIMDAVTNSLGERVEHSREPLTDPDGVVVGRLVPLADAAGSNEIAMLRAQNGKAQVVPLARPERYGRASLSLLTVTGQVRALLIEPSLNDGATVLSMRYIDTPSPAAGGRPQPSEYSSVVLPVTGAGDWAVSPVVEGYRLSLYVLSTAGATPTLVDQPIDIAASDSMGRAWERFSMAISNRGWVAVGVQTATTFNVSFLGTGGGA